MLARCFASLKTYASVLDVPQAIDMATVYVQPDVAQRLLPESHSSLLLQVYFRGNADINR